MVRRWMAAMAVLAVLAAGCGGDDSSSDDTSGEAASTTTTTTTATTDDPAGEGSGTAASVPDTPAGAALAWVLDALATPPSLEELEPRFDEEFREAVTMEELAEIFTALAAEGTPVLTSVTEDGPHELDAEVQLGATSTQVLLAVEEDEPHRIIGLLFRPVGDPVPIPDTLQELTSTWDGLAERSTLLVAEVSDGGECRPLLELRAEERLPVASAFKLFVLVAVADAVASGSVDWDQPVPIRDELKSLPSGTFQELPAGTERTVAEHARAMIADSDNTATDHLIALVGREAVEIARLELAAGGGDAAPLVPFLTTREAFILKYGADEEAVRRWVDGDIDARRQVLAELADAPLPSLDELTTEPTLVDEVEWLASPVELCRALAALDHRAATADLAELDDILLAPDALTGGELSGDQRGWFKGGSEPGVLNLSALASEEGLTLVATGTLVDADGIGADPNQAMQALLAGLGLAAEEILGEG